MGFAPLPRRPHPAPGAAPWSCRRRSLRRCVQGGLSVGLSVLTRGVSVWQGQALGLDLPVVALPPHIAQGTLQVGYPLLRGFEPNRGDRIRVSTMERGLSVHGEGAGELGRVDEPCPIIV